MPKDNPFSDNPFGTAQDDPFAAHAASTGAAGGGGKSSAWGNGGAWGANNGEVYAGASAPATNAFTASSGTGGGSNRKDLLDIKEKELAAREAELNRREEELRKAGALVPKKNWPICYPILHHDIAGDVPAEKQRMVRQAYFSWLGFLIAVTFNWFGALMALCIIDPNNGRLPGFLLANIYWFAGLPGAWILWYIRVYNASRNDRAFTYAWFFLTFLVHIAFCVWASVSPPLIYKNDWGHAGFITGIGAFDSSNFVGVVYMIGGSLWALEAVWSIWVIKTVYSSFRGSGGTTRLKQEAAQSAVRHGMKQAGNRSNVGAGDV